MHGICSPTGGAKILALVLQREFGKRRCLRGVLEDRGEVHRRAIIIFMRCGKLRVYRLGTFRLVRSIDRARTPAGLGGRESSE